MAEPLSALLDDYCGPMSQSMWLPLKRLRRTSGSMLSPRWSEMVLRWIILRVFWHCA